MHKMTSQNYTGRSGKKKRAECRIYGIENNYSGTDSHFFLHDNRIKYLNLKSRDKNSMSSLLAILSNGKISVQKCN